MSSGGLTGPLAETPEQGALRETVRGILRRHLPPDRALELDAGQGFDPAVWTAFADAGLLGLGADPTAGGSGGGAGDQVAVVEEVARALPGLAVGYVVALMAMRTLSDPAAGAARDLLPAVADGTVLPAYAMSEPDVGTDLLRLRTTARLDGDRWVLRGHKTWTTFGTRADVLFVVARTDPPTDGRLARGLSMIAVATDQPGVTRRRIPMAGMRAGLTTEIFLDDATAPAANLVGERGRIMPVLGRTLDIERLLAAAISLGIASAAFDLHLRYARERTAFGRPIGAFQAVQHPIADSAADVAALRALLEAIARRIDDGADAVALAAMAKLQAGEVAARVVDRGMRAMGAMGLAAESAMQMYFRDARLALFSPVSNEMARNMIGEALGLPRSY